MSQGMVSFKELFDFSRRSEDSANLVRELTASLEPRAQISVSESENAFEILLTRPKHSSSFTTILKIILPTSEKAQKIREKHPEAIETIRINNVEFVFYLETEAYRGYDVIVSEDLKKDGMMLLEHLKDIFSAELLEIAPGDSSLVSEAPSKKLSVKEGKVSHGEMSKFLEDKLEKKTLLCAPEPPEFTHPYPILADQLVIQNSQWFTRQNLLNLDCSRIYLGRSTLTSEDLNQFIKRWVHSDNTKFKQLLVSEAVSEHRMLDWDVISSGVEWIPTSEKNELIKYNVPIKKPTSGFDIKRDDGQVATVIIGESECGNEEILFEVQKPKKKAGEPCLFPTESDCHDRFAFNQMLRECKKTHAEMGNLLENGDSKQMNIHQVPEEGFVYDKPISTESLSLEHSTWFTRQNLLNLDCVNVKLNSNRLTNEDINAFISQWYHSDNKKFGTLSIYGFGSYREAPFKPDIAIITAGIPTVPGKNRETKQIPFTRKRKYEIGLDIIRSDGLEANVVLQDVPYINTQQLFFTVFHPKEEEEKKPIDFGFYQKVMKKAFDEIGVVGFDFQ